jgi:integrase
MIAYVYRPKRRINGKLVSARLWRARLKLSGDASARDIPLGVSDKQSAEQKLRDSIREHERAGVGLTAPAAQREAFESPMERLVDDYVADLKALGRSADHIRHVDKRLRRLMRECHWSSLREATPDSYLRWRAKQTQAPKTINEYHAALSALFSWLRTQSRVAVNPFEHLSKVDTRGKESFHRRALSDEEAVRLLAGPRRALYLLALFTGLRRGEINALRWAHLNLEVANPWYLVPTANSKSRKEQPRPLHPQLVTELRALKLASKGTPETLVFPEGVPPMKVIRADFEAAQIAPVDERGHRIDFHALRTTYITRLQRCGVSPREAMELARHSDMRLTMKTYTDLAQLPLAATVRQLPPFGDTQIDTQTSVVNSPGVSPSVLGLKAIKVGKSAGNIDGNHSLSLAVAAGHEKSEWRREGDSNPRKKPPRWGRCVFSSLPAVASW